MLILGIDTSGKNGSIALVRFDGWPTLADFARVGFADCGTFAALDVVPLSGNSYSEELVPKLTQLLDRHHTSKSALDAFAVSTGPGSFTGLRVGLSTVKALADALHKPIAAITALEAVAWNVDAQGRIFVALDAGRRQLYAGEFLAEGRLRTPLSEYLVDVATFADRLQQDRVPVFTPDPQLAESLPVCTIVPQPMADAYARIGAERILAGNTISPAELDAHYMRHSDAEIFFQGPK